MEYKLVGQLKVPQNLDPEKQKLVNEIASNYLNELSDINLENTKKRSKLAAGAGLEIGSAFIPAGLGVRLSGTAIKALAPYVGRKIAKEIGTGIVSGGLSGAGFGAGRGIIENKNPIRTAAYDALIGASIGGAGGAAIGKVGKEIAKKNLKNFKDSNNYYKNYEQGQKINNDDIGNIILTSQGFKETNIQNPKFFDKVIDLSKNLRGAKLLGKELPTNEHKYNIDYFNRLGGNDVDYLVAHNADSGKNFFHKVTDKELTSPKPEAQSPSNNIIANKEQNLNPFNQYFDDYIADLKNKTNAMQEYRALKEGINPSGKNILYDTPITETEAFKIWSNNNPIVTSEDALNYPFKTGKGVTLEGYHGTKRGDRVGSEFRKDRATSGPMAFFSSNKDIAKGYAEGKVDTSLRGEMSDYGNWFKYRDSKGNLKPLSEAWNDLTPQERFEISKNAPHITFDDEAENIIYNPAINYGTGNYDYAIKSNKNNHLKALIDEWLQSGNLYGKEGDFYKVLEKSGINMNNIDYIDPYADYSKIYDVFLSMKNPLVTDDIPANLIEQLSKEAPKHPASGYGVDFWDKNVMDGNQWITKLKEDLADGKSSHAWTSIPDWVTDELKKAGYDGIIDMGGKSGGQIHKVYIPFEPTQIKSQMNEGTFDLSNPNIYKSILGTLGAYQMFKNSNPQ